MKTKSTSVRLLIATAALGAFAAIAYAADSGSPTWQNTKPITTFSEAAKVGPDDTVTMQCKGCKTVMIRNSKHVGPPSKGHEESFVVGSKHTCTECKGEITLVKGTTKDSMQHNCSSCGDASVVCSVAMSEVK